MGKTTAGPSQPRTRRQLLRTTALVVALASGSGCLDGAVDDDAGDGGSDAASMDPDDDGPADEPADDPPTEDDPDDPPTEDDPDDEAADDEPPEGDDDSVEPYETAIHDRINEIRGQHGVEPLAYDDEIAAIAREHSVDMVERNYFSHESPDGEGLSDRLSAFFPGHCRGIGENIAYLADRPGMDPETVAERVTSNWMDSSGHRRNILSDSFNVEGIGVAFGDSRILFTQKFCTTQR